MNITEMRAAYREALLSREKKNQYSQAENKRLLIESGWGDCSSTPYYWMKKLFGLNIGDYTGAQIESPLGQVVDLDIRGGVPDESGMEIGDHLYFRGNDASRTQGVGHVEIYIGNGQCFGHGSGMGGTVKDMASYCAKRQATASTSSKLKNKGLICVIRYLHEDTPIQSDQDYVVRLYREILGREPDAAGAAGWVAALQGGARRESVRQGFLGSEEYKRLHGEPETPAEGGYVMQYTMPRLSRANKDTQSATAVKIWQAIIGVDPDGRFGPATEKATIKFEQAHGINDNPQVVGPRAWALGLAEFM